MPKARPCLAITESLLSILVTSSFCSLVSPVLSRTSAISPQAKIPNYIAIGKMFEQNFLFEVPKYQRYYAWEDEQIKDYII